MSEAEEAFKARRELEELFSQLGNSVSYSYANLRIPFLDDGFFKEIVWRFFGVV